jgi:hypothetical protein
MTRYLRTDAVNSHCQIAFAEWGFPVRPGCGFFILAIPESQFRHQHCRQNQPFAVHRQALTALLASRLASRP